MKVTHDTELMQYQQLATIMGPDHAFQVLESDVGMTLFFSIGTDKSLYLTREKPTDKVTTGWEKKDLLWPFFGNTAFEVTAFAVAKNPNTTTIDIVVAVGVRNAANYVLLWLKDYRANEESLNKWETLDHRMLWKTVSFQPPQTPGQMGPGLPGPINKIYLQHFKAVGTAQSAPGLCCYVDIAKQGGSLRYRVPLAYAGDPKLGLWIEHPTPSNFQSILSSSLGLRNSDGMPGMYTLGEVSRVDRESRPCQLVFTPERIDPHHVHIVLPMPDSVRAITSFQNKHGKTIIFIAGERGLQCYGPDAQDQQPSSVLANYSGVGESGRAGLLYNTRFLAACTCNSRTSVWGINEEDELWYSHCAAGNETIMTMEDWPNPIIMYRNVRHFAYYLNMAHDCHVTFAHLDAPVTDPSARLVKLTQDPATTVWSESQIRLPSSDVDALDFPAFTTQVQARDDNNLPLRFQTLYLTATSPVTVFVDGYPTKLVPDTPVQLQTDPTGNISIVQETRALSAVCYRVYHSTLPDLVVIDPMAKARQRLATIKNGSDLASAMVLSDDGTRKRLVPNDVSGADRDATAAAIAQMAAVFDQVKDDGSRGYKPKPKIAAAVAVAGAAAPPTATAFSLAFKDDKISFSQGAAAAAPVQALGLADDSGSGPLSIAGDVLHLISQLGSKITSFVVHAASGVWRFTVQVGNSTWSFLLDSLATVGRAIETVWARVKVFFKDLWRFVGFVFEWNDILHTHRVVKHMARMHMLHAIDQIDGFASAVIDGTEEIKEKVRTWAKLQSNAADGDAKRTSKDHAKTHDSLQGQREATDSPQANWVANHAKQNIARSSGDDSTSVIGVPSHLFDNLKVFVERERDTLYRAVDDVRTNILDKFHDLTALEIVEKLLAVVASAVLESASTILQALFGMIKVALRGAYEALDAEVKIPVLSRLYTSKITKGDPLTVLDLSCLAVAVPATLVFKLLTRAAPFPAEEENWTSELLGTTSLEGFVRVFMPDSFSTMPQRQWMMGMAVDAPRQHGGEGGFGVAQVQAKIQAMAMAGPGSPPYNMTGEDVFAVLTNTIACAAGYLYTYFSYQRDLLEAAKMPIPLPHRGAVVVTYVLFNASGLSGVIDAFKEANNPGGKGTEYPWRAAGFNNTIGMISIAKTLFENTAWYYATGKNPGEKIPDGEVYREQLAPYVESALSLAWGVTTSVVMFANGASGKKPSAYVAYAGTMAFNVAGALTAVQHRAQGNVKAYVALGRLGLTTTCWVFNGIVVPMIMNGE